MHLCISSRKLRFAFTLLFLLPCLLAQAQIDYKNALPQLQAQLATSKQDTNRVRLALTISSFYITNRGVARANTDSAYKYQRVAERLSADIGFKNGQDDAALMAVRLLLRRNDLGSVLAIVRRASAALYCRIHIEIGKHYLLKGGEEKADMDLSGKHLAIAQNFAQQNKLNSLYGLARVYRYPLMLEQRVKPYVAEAEFNRIIALCKRINNKRLEALARYYKALQEEDNALAVNYYNQAVPVADAAGDIALAIDMRRERGDRYFRQGKFDQAERELLTVISMYRRAGFRNQQFAYDLFTAVNVAKSNFEAAMRYGLEAIKYADSTGTDYGTNYMQFRLANICRDMGLKKESIKWSEKCLNSTIVLENRFPYSVYRELSADLIKEGRAGEVLKSLAIYVKKYPPGPERAFFLPLVKGDCYAALKKPDLAERYYLEAMKLFEQREIYDIYYYSCCKNIAGFYVSQKLYNKAIPYLKRIFDTENPVFRMTDVADAHTLQFKIDSARGDYRAAIRHFQTSKSITDSIFNEVRLRQSEQLQLQFDMAQRDHENLALRNMTTMQQGELEKGALSRRLTLLALLCSVIFTGLLLYLYRAKQKSNKLLQVRQDEINIQNDKLNQLLTEKEWLMKEIHHRVKNNLQIISSLLNTQSSYLDNEQALLAIRDSQNRMQAISIVHQKLYQSDDMSTIDLIKYIEELAQSIRDSFEVRSNINFKFDVQDIRLNTADTVPLGLILNEAITNSVKYAFDDGSRGTITIAMFMMPNGRCRLIVHDDGKGLPANFDVNNCTSLGINLMIGLTSQLNGKFDIESDGGTIITITFVPSSVELAFKTEKPV